MNLCGSACQTRGICSNGECVCSNRTYTGNDCEMCRVTETVRAGCFQLSTGPSASCMCYLSRSQIRQTPYLCIASKDDRGETGSFQWVLTSIVHFARIWLGRSPVRSHRIAMDTWKLLANSFRRTCLWETDAFIDLSCSNTKLHLSRNHEEATYLLQWWPSDHRWQDKLYIMLVGSIWGCRQILFSSHRCSFPYSGPQCQWNPCADHCRNNGTCTLDGMTPACQ